MVNDSAIKRAEYELELLNWQESEGGREPDRRGSAVALELLSELGALSNDTHAKLKVLRELITEKHASEHILLYTSFGPMLLPLLSDLFEEWGVSHVTYHGTPAQKQRAYDAYRTGDYQVWWSSDAGADSIDLELATVGIDFDLPWKYTTRTQRWNRANRAGAVHDFQTFYSLMMANSIEDRKLQIIEKKQGYHEGVYEGKLNEAAAAARMSKDDFLYILFGDG
jgi:SNF2 family DNA or RNA helicase